MTTRSSFSGKVAAVGGRMLRGGARVLIQQFFSALARRLGKETATATAAGPSAVGTDHPCPGARPMKPPLFDYLPGPRLWKKRWAP